MFWPTVAIFRENIGIKEYIFDTKCYHGCAQIKYIQRKEKKHTTLGTTLVLTEIFYPVKTSNGQA
jgi:hypothetical protein